MTACSTPTDVSAVSAETELQLKIDRIVDAAVVQGFAGQVVVAGVDRVLYQRQAGYSDSAKKVPVKADTLFHVASISKYFTAILVVKSAEEGKIDLDDNIASWVPDTELAKRDITFRQLLHHQSGLGSSYAAENAVTAKKALDVLDGQTVDEEKRGRFKYSNDGYNLLAIILERIYGKPYEVLLSEKIKKPAGLKNIKGWSEVDKTDPRKVGQPLQPLPEKLLKRNYGMIGSAGIFTTADDLVRLQKALRNGKILSEQSLESLWRPTEQISIGRATAGGFLRRSEIKGLVFSARGNEDWGDNAILNYYHDHDFYVAVVTSKGPAEDTGQPPFCSSMSQAIEKILPTSN
ncbi:MAG: serine hydrolase domain-containing protein [Parasphingorhabdus sp.]